MAASGEIKGQIPKSGDRGDSSPVSQNSDYRSLMGRALNFHFISFPINRSRFWMDPSLIFRGCRNCRTCFRRRCGAVGWRSTRKRPEDLDWCRAMSSRFHPVRERFRLPVLISPGIAPNIIAMPMGQGHETFTRFASGRGANPISILAPIDRTRNRRTGVGGDTGSNFESDSRIQN